LNWTGSIELLAYPFAEAPPGYGTQRRILGPFPDIQEPPQGSGQIVGNFVKEVANRLHGLAGDFSPGRGEHIAPSPHISAGLFQLILDPAEIVYQR